MLASHLKRIDSEATDMLMWMEDEYIKKNPLPQGDDFMAVVRARN